MDATPLHIWTPTIYSKPLSQLTTKNIWLKMECYQPGGSFKIRGIGRLCQHYLLRTGKTRLVSSSAGNAGIAVAYCAKKLGVQADVFLPRSSRQIYIDMLKLENANIHVIGEVWDDADRAARSFVAEVDGAYIPPFEHPLIWFGHATLIAEVAATGIIPDAVVVAVGGGGLAVGLLEGMYQQGWDDIPLVAVEPLGAASFAASVKAGKLVKLSNIDTISTSLGVKSVSSKLLEWEKKHCIQSILVSDKDSVLAIKNFANDHRVLIEPASGASLSVVYNNHPALAAYRNILVIVCGGNGISLEILNEYLATCLKS